MMSHYSPETRENDQIQAKLYKAAFEGARTALRDILQERPEARIRDLQPHQVERVAGCAVDGYIVERERHLELARMLGDAPPPDWRI